MMPTHTTGGIDHGQYYMLLDFRLVVFGH